MIKITTIIRFNRIRKIRRYRAKNERWRQNIQTEDRCYFFGINPKKIFGFVLNNKIYCRIEYTTNKKAYVRFFVTDGGKHIFTWVRKSALYKY